MLERVPAAAESTAHYFLRSVDKPARSSRVLDPRFWRNGADNIDSSAWWPLYLQRVRTVPQSNSCTSEEYPASSCHSSARPTKSSLPWQRNDPVLSAALVSRSHHVGTTTRPYSVSLPNHQVPNPQVEQVLVGNDDIDETVVRDKPPSNLKQQRHRQHGKRDSQEPVLQNTGLRATSRKPSTHDTARHELLNTFDLNLDSTPDWLDANATTPDMLQLKARPQSIAAYDLQQSTSEVTAASRASSIPQKPRLRTTVRPSPGDSASNSRTSSSSVHQSFDLDTLHQSTSKTYSGNFDLEAIIQHQRDLGIQPEPESQAESVKHTKQDMYTGFASSPFSALVPDEASHDIPEREEPLLQSPDASDKTEESALHANRISSDPSVALPPHETANQDSLSKWLQSSTSDEDFQHTGSSMYLDDRPNELTSRELGALREPLNESSLSSTSLLQTQRLPFSTEEAKAKVSVGQSLNPRQARFDTLLRLKAAATKEQFDEAWSLFLSFDHQEELAQYVFRFLNYSQDDKHVSKALAAFNTVPRSRRTRDMYQAAIDLELRRYQHGTAINLAFEGSVRGFELLPGLLAYLVSNLLWNSVGELLHRNRSARQDYAQFASDSQHPDGEQMQMLSLPQLLQRCDTIPNLHAKVLSLAERLQSSSSAFVEHRGSLNLLCQRLLIEAVRGSETMSKITPQATLALLDLEQFFSNSLGLHTKALQTIFQLPHRSSKFGLAMVVYRNLRFKHPANTPTPQILGELISLCGEADQPSDALYSYLLAQYKTKPPRKVFHEIMMTFARKGNVELVFEYFNRFVKQYGLPRHAADLNSMIYVYAMLGDVVKAREHFDKIETKFSLVPDTVSWNTLMLAHVRSADDTSAFDIQAEMQERNVKADQYTYGQLLAVCAAHGDTETALDVLVDARDAKIEISVVMINTIVDTYLKNDDPQAALKFAMTVMGSQDQKALTRLWNSFLRYYAFKGRVVDLLKIRDVMARHNVASDGMTYVPMLALLTSLRRSSEAVELLRKMHQEENIPLARIHYSIILHGLVAEGNRNMTSVILSEMKQRFPDIAATVSKTIAQLQARRDGIKEQTSPDAQILSKLLKDAALADELSLSLASARSRTDTASVALETIARNLMRSGSNSAAARILENVDHSSIVGLDTGSGQTSLSKGISLVRLNVAIQRQDWRAFDTTWSVIYQDAVKANRSVTAIRKGYTKQKEQTTLSTVMASHTKYSLSSYLNCYMEAMARQGRQSDMKKFLREQLSRSGFVFTGKNWNKYIQVLCRSRDPADQIQAFRTFERIMRTRTQSWNLLARGNMRTRTTSYLWEPYGQRTRPILQKSIKYRVVKRSEQLRIHPEKRIPTYTTAVYLGAVLAQAHLRAQSGSLGQFDTIRKAAPRTKRFIQYMPRLKDGIQGSILRQLGERDNQRSRPRSEEAINRLIDPVGIASDPSPLARIPVDYLSDIEEMMGPQNPVRTLLRHRHTSKSLPDPEHSDVELGEVFTGQISREPIVLAGKGRLESVSEAAKRIASEQKKKRQIVERLREDLQARKLTGDILRLPLHAEPPVDSRPADSKEINTNIEDKVLRRKKAGKSKKTGDMPTVQQDLERVAEIREARKRNHKTGPPAIPQLALSYMDRRRQRRRISLRQRQQTNRLIEAQKHNFSARATEPRTRAAKRLETFERDQQRRQAVLKYERDLKAGKRLDPFPRTRRGLYERRYLQGPVRVRFAPDLNRNPTRYAIRKGWLPELRQPEVQATSKNNGLLITREARRVAWMRANYGVKREAVRRMEEMEDLRDAVGEEIGVDFDPYDERR